MKLLIIRHGDPDYEHDSLTEKGWREASLLAGFLRHSPPDYVYMSPLGRAKDTASCTLKVIGKEGIVLDWLREFPGTLVKPNLPGQESIAWDWLPQDWTGDERFFSDTLWYDQEIIRKSNVKEQYDKVSQSLDALLAEHGYERQGRRYHAAFANNDTIALFCHFGVECVLLSHLLNLSPMTLWHGFCAAPSSVTTLVTEERREGIAYFRTLRFGDVSHLVLGSEEPSFAARFCEKYGNPGERID